jgi:hypothetical protein
MESNEIQPEETPDVTAPPVEGELESPYRNMWMPLVVIPGAIVIVLVLIFLAFGGITGSEPSIENNLALVSAGGKNQRTQAAFNLSQKIVANSNAILEGKPAPYPVPPDLKERVEGALAAARDDEIEAKVVLASLLVQLGEESGVTHLMGLMDLTDEQDPEGNNRFVVLVTLGTSGDSRVVPTVIKACESQDVGIRSLAAILLQQLEGEGVVPALQGLLNDGMLEVRANSAISLTRHKDPSGAELLYDLMGTEIYAAENASDPKRFRSGQIVSRSRSNAAVALARLGRIKDRQRVQAHGQDPDLEFRAVVLETLQNWEFE